MCPAGPINSRRSRKRINMPSQRFPINMAWNSPILPTEKQNKTIGRPIVQFRKVMDGIMYIIRTGCQWKMLPGECGSGSTRHRRFQEWVQLDIFRKIWARLLEIYNDKEGIKGHGNRLTAYP
jgi:transposase